MHITQSKMSAKAAKRVVKQLAGSGTGQSLMDRVTQAKYSLAGSGLGKAVAKASTEEIGSPKRKHLDYLISCSNEPNVSIPLLAGLLVERIQDKSWVVVFKGLITTHNLMNFGNEKFSHYLASNSSSLSLENFNDKTSPQSYEMSLFIRRYSRYVNEKSCSYRAMAFDFCKVKRGREDGVLRTMPIDKLLKALPVLSSQISVLLEFDAQEKDLNNPIIIAAFLLLYKDLVRLFASYNEGMINLIEHYFTLQPSQCRIGLDLYNSFPAVQAKLTEFLTLAETMGIGEKDSLGLQPVPAKVIQAMEQHLAIIERKKGKGGDDEDVSPGKACPQRPSASPRTVGRPKPLASTPASTSVPVKVTPAPSADPVEEHQLTSQVASTAVATNEETGSVTPTVVVVGPPSQDEDVVEGSGGAGGSEASEMVEETVCEDDASLPSDVQREVIAAATSMFNDSLMKSNEAVRRSAEQTSLPVVHTQLGRHEQHTVPVRARSRSPSPARPHTPVTGHNDGLQLKTGSGGGGVGGTSVSDGELDSHEATGNILRATDPAAVAGGGGGGSLSQQESRKPSSLALNDSQPVNGSRSLICSSPFADDEAPTEPVTSDPGWPTAAVETDGDRSEFTATFASPTPAPHPLPSSSKAMSTGLEVNPPNQSSAAPAGSSSALDDLLGLDLLATDFNQEAGGEPVIQPTEAVSGDLPASAVSLTPASTDKPACLDDDLLSLDPLLNPSSSQPVTATTVGAATSPSDPDQLPAGLKKVSTNIPIRPAVMQQQHNQQQKKDPLDALDSTLANLASSLGGQQKPWGAGSSKNRP